MRLLLSRKLRLTLSVGLAIAGLGLRAGSASACGTDGYTYAGVASRSPAYGVSATVTPLAGINVLAGHVAGWVGVGGPGLGPNGTDEWLQVGFSDFPGTSGNDMYYELKLPNRQPTYHELATGVPSGRAARVAVLETRQRPNVWRVWLNGKPVSGPIHMPGSHGRWAPIATAESWDGATGDGACNGFLYSFRQVSIATVPGGGWQQLVESTPITNTSTRVKQSGVGSFLAAQGDAALRTLSALRRRT